MFDQIVKLQVSQWIDIVHGRQRVPGFTHIFGGARRDGNITSRSRVPSAMPSSSRNNCCSQPRSRDEINAIHSLTSISLHTTYLARPLHEDFCPSDKTLPRNGSSLVACEVPSLPSVLNFGFQVSGC